MSGEGVSCDDHLIEIIIDGMPVRVPAGIDILSACDRAGVYVPRLCVYPGFPSLAEWGPDGAGCGLCVVRIGDGRLTRACMTRVSDGLVVATDDEQLRVVRRERLAQLMKGHPSVCLGCPDRDGCLRDDCTYGNPPEARCCDKGGECELAMLAAFVGLSFSGLAVSDRAAVVEGRIRREPGLCVGCGRCVSVCEHAEGAGQALEMVVEGAAIDRRLRAAPKGGGTLRAAGCTFCGRCVLVCPTGALMAPGEAGRRWLEGRRVASGLAPAVLPPRPGVSVQTARERIPRGPGVLQLLDETGEALGILGVPDLREGLDRALRDPSLEGAHSVRWEEAALYSQRESELLTRHVQQYGKLPRGNVPDDDLFNDDLFDDDDL